MNGSMHGMMNGSMMYGMGWVMMLICLLFTLLFFAVLVLTIMGLLKYWRDKNKIAIEKYRKYFLEVFRLMIR